jgi:HEAT repeat protein
MTLVAYAEIDPSSIILTTLAGMVLLTILLYCSGALGAVIQVACAIFYGAITRGFLVWQRLFSWAPWPVFLGLELGLTALGIDLIGSVPALSVLIAIVPLSMGITACLAYMYIDWERYEVARGYKSINNPLKGQALADHLLRHGHRVGVMLLASAAIGICASFALLNEGLYHSLGNGWYGVDGLTGSYTDFLAFALLNLYGMVDLLDLRTTRQLFAVPHIKAEAWEASSLLTFYKTFFTLVLVQQLFASVRNAKVLGETIADFWSPHEPIHLRARGTLPLYGLAAITPLLGSLRSQSLLTKEQREQLPRILADMGPAIVPVLIAHLRDKHPDVRAVAVAAAGHMEAAEALPVLLKLGDDPSPAVRQNLAAALGTIGAKGCVPARRLPRPIQLRRARMRLWLQASWWWWKKRYQLAEPLAAVALALRTKLADSSPGVRLEAAKSLGLIGQRAGSAATADLLGLLGDQDETVRCEAALTLGKIGASDQSTQAALVDLLKDGSAAIRAAAAQSLGLLQESAAPAVPALVEALRDPDDNVRQAVSEAIGEIGTVPEAAMVPLVGGLSSPDTLVRANTARALGEIGSAAAEAAPALVEAMEDSNDAVRAEAVEALGKLGTAAADIAVPGIVHALHDPDSWVSALAAEALGEMGESAEQAVPALMRSLTHVSAKVRANAAEALGKIGPMAQQTRAALIRAAGDAAGEVRCQAIRALGQLGPDAEARPVLRAALADPVPQVRAASAEAFGQWQDSGPDLTADLVNLLSDANDEVKVQAAQVLPRLFGPMPELIERLCQRLLKDDSVWVQEQAALALGRLGTAAEVAGPALVQAAQTAEASVREQALHALALIQPPDAAVAFMAELKDASADIRRMASAGWRRAKAIPEEAVAGLVDALRDPDVAVRTNVAYALSRLDAVPASAVPLLLECAAHPADGLRLHAALALQAVATPAIAGDLAHLLEDPNLSIRLIVARTLLPIESRQAAALAVVTQALASESPAHRRAAVRLVESMDLDLEELRAVLRRQIAVETDGDLRDDMASVLTRLESVAAAKAPATIPMPASLEVVFTK